jgi:hypothetical protein
MAKTSDQVQTTIYLPKNIHMELRIKSVHEHVSMTKLIIRAVKRELNESIKDKERSN